MSGFARRFKLSGQNVNRAKKFFQLSAPGSQTKTYGLSGVRVNG